MYTMIGGLDGCGKSSLTGCLKRERTDLGKIIDVDKLNAQYGNIVEGGKAAVQEIDRCLMLGVNFTQETTLSGIRTLKTARQARERGYHVRLYYVGLNSAQESLERIRNRVQKGGHNIPEADVLRRYQRRFHDLAAILPYCDEAVFYDNYNGFQVVAEYRNGEIVPQTEVFPKWLLDFRAWMEQGEDLRDPDRQRDHKDDVLK